jgi:hypothetical protein
VLRKFAATARKRMRIEGGGYRRDHLRALTSPTNETHGFNVSLFHAATILMLVAFDGFRPSHAPASCSRRQPLNDEFFV